MRRRGGGFTLVELMVTLAVMAVLAAVGTPFARQWIDSNRQMQARNLMWEAVSQTRALALRNPGQVAGSAPAARLQANQGALQVTWGEADEVYWQGQLPNGAELRLTNTEDFSDAQALMDSGSHLDCVAFGNRGQRLPAATGCSTAAIHGRIAVGLNDQEPLYVDLL